MKRMTKGITSLVVVSLFSLFPVLDSVSAASFTTCSSFNAKYPKGVAKSGSAARKQKITPKVSASIYKTHRKLDKDNDGTVCEVKKVGIGSTTNTVVSVATTTSTTTTMPKKTINESVPLVGKVSGFFFGNASPIPSVPERSLSSYETCGVGEVNVINFQPQTRQVFPCTQVDNVLLKFEGVIPKSNQGVRSLDIQVRSDDGVYLAIDGNVLLDKWSDGYSKTQLLKVTLDLDIDHQIELWYYEKVNTSQLTIHWYSKVPTTATSLPVAGSSTTLPVVRTTTCSPNQSAINTLKERAGSWQNAQNKTRTVALLKYNGSDYGIWSVVFDSNNSVFTRALAALNSCKQIGYVFDDWNLILNKADRTRNLRLSDSVAYLVGA